MKIIFSILMASVVLLVVTEPAAGALFNTTNTFAVNSSITSWPTNSIGTNGIGALTGNALDVRWNDTAAFYLQGYASGTSTGTLSFSFVRAWCDNPPLVTTNQNDWESSPGFTIVIPVSAAGAISWGTNLTQELIGRANWLGIYAISNTCASLTITNSTPFNTATNSLCLGHGAQLNTKVTGVRLR